MIFLDKEERVILCFDTSLLLVLYNILSSLRKKCYSAKPISVCHWLADIECMKQSQTGLTTLVSWNTGSVFCHT